jgi:hypothetical protein
VVRSGSENRYLFGAKNKEKEAVLSILCEMQMWKEALGLVKPFALRPSADELICAKAQHPSSQ